MCSFSSFHLKIQNLIFGNITNIRQHLEDVACFASELTNTSFPNFIGFWGKYCRNNIGNVFRSSFHQLIYPVQACNIEEIQLNGDP